MKKQQAAKWRYVLWQTWGCCIVYYVTKKTACVERMLMP